MSSITRIDSQRSDKTQDIQGILDSCDPTTRSIIEAILAVQSAAKKKANETLETDDFASMHCQELSTRDGRISHSMKYSPQDRAIVLTKREVKSRKLKFFLGGIEWNVETIKIFVRSDIVVNIEELNGLRKKHNQLLVENAIHLIRAEVIPSLLQFANEQNLDPTILARLASFQFRRVVPLPSRTASSG